MKTMNTKRAFTLIELMIVIAIITIIAAIAIPNLLRHRTNNIIGKEMIVKESGQKVEVIRRVNERESNNIFVCRIDNGPNANPRYQQLEFRYEELVKIEPAVEK